MHDEDAPERSVLVLGGTDFMGRAIVDALVGCMRGGHLCMFTRGRRHWNDVNRYPERVTHVKGDRHSPALPSVLQQRRWDVIVDLTCFSVADVTPVLAHAGHALYIFISTDSVYEVCAVPAGQASREDHDTRRALRDGEDVDDYGLAKWEVEQALKAQAAVRWFALRLPDVVGPHENTGRLWSYLMWLAVSDTHPVYVSPRTDTQQLSFVCSLDVAALVVRLIEQQATVAPCRAFNVACDERVGLRAFLHMYAEEAGLPEPHFHSTDDGSQYARELLPSVTVGPVDGSLVQSVVGFRPMALRAAVAATARFFADAWDRFPQEREEVLEDFPKTMRARIRRHFGAV